MKLIAGNWKMHGLKADISELQQLLAADLPPTVELLLCPPVTLLARCADLAAGSRIAVGAQDCHAAASGAHTGDIAAEMLADAGATYVIVGHSERRADHQESSAMVQAKAQAAARAGLVPIICIGETLAEREAGQAVAVVTRQLLESVPEHMDVVIAYEPVWAIGTGHTPTTDQVAEIHAAIAARVARAARILYGGSVKLDNAAELLAIPHVDGALVGGASLKAADFLAIMNTQA